MYKPHFYHAIASLRSKELPNFEYIGYYQMFPLLEALEGALVDSWKSRITHHLMVDAFFRR